MYNLQKRSDYVTIDCLFFQFTANSKQLHKNLLFIITDGFMVVRIIHCREKLYFHRPSQNKRVFSL